MLKLIDVITNNYFLKQKLKVTIPKTPVRRLTDSWQGSTKSGKRLLSNPINKKTISDFTYLDLSQIKGNCLKLSTSISLKLQNLWISIKDILVKGVL